MPRCIITRWALFPPHAPVPSGPGEIKAVVASDDSAIISWSVPLTPRGVITKYSVHVVVPGDRGRTTEERLMPPGAEVPAEVRHFELNGLTAGEPIEVRTVDCVQINPE